MTPDEQEAGSIRYACLYHVARLSSGKFVLLTNQQSNRQIVCIGDAAAIADALAEIPPEAFIAAAPKAPAPAVSAAELDDLLGDLML